MSKRITDTMSLEEAAKIMSEGNAGASTVINKLSMDDLKNLDLMGIYGSHIWVAYKDIYKSNLELLKSNIKDFNIWDDLRELPKARTQKGDGMTIMSGDKVVYHGSNEVYPEDLGK